MATSDKTVDDSLYPIAVLIDELKNEDVQNHLDQEGEKWYCKPEEKHIGSEHSIVAKFKICSLIRCSITFESAGHIEIGLRSSDQEITFDLGIERHEPSSNQPGT
ncbi:uncharacterized protein LOC124418573 [Lucilia cuprina]|uniref:uncharacterized protein LOC124418573 n=1 Tax=Lucilia cuprina TaxID=7375 RepID=UPI001F05D77E|nr:uncharacterized protein LOC124418573 [Lucilia cuprina]